MGKVASRILVVVARFAGVSTMGNVVASRVLVVAARFAGVSTMGKVASRALALVSAAWMAAAWTGTGVDAQTPRPQVQRIEPAAGPIGARVDVVGRHFTPEVEVHVGERQAVVERQLPHRLRIRVPEGATSGPIRVRTKRGAADGPTFRVMLAAPAPHIRRIEPRRARVGSEVRILGRSFSARLADNRVSLGDVPVIVRRARPDALVVVVPEVATNARFRVQVAQAGEALSEPLIVEPRREDPSRPEPGPMVPVVTRITPPAAAPGHRITLHGHRLDATDLTVHLGDRRAPVQSRSAEALVVELPEGATTDELRVRAGQAGEVLWNAPFVVLPPTAIRRVEPDSGPPDTEVTLHGQGFSEEPARNQVYLGERRLPVKAASATTLTVVVPDIPSGPFRVQVHGNRAATTAAPFVVEHPPRLTRFEPNFGPAGTRITLHGSGFGEDAELIRAYLGDTTLEVRSVHDDQVVVEIPEGAPSGSGVITVHRALQGEARYADTFEVLPSPSSP